MYFQLTTKYMVFYAASCFVHKSLPSSARYSSLGYMQRVMQLVSRKFFVSLHNYLAIIKIVIKL
jgi:hypothetical protein